MPNPSRNDPCPCASGKKYKHCCLPGDERAAATRQAQLQENRQAFPALIDAGIRLHLAGQLGDAQRHYQEVLRLNPNDPDALHLLGVIARDTGNPEQAIALIGQAIGILPGEASFHSNLGMAYRQGGRLDEAMACYEKALALNPGHAEALNNLGNLRTTLNRLPQAIDCFQRAIAAKPAFAEAHFNLGHVFQTLQRNEEALACYREALAIRPGYVDALSNCGMTLHALGRDEEALACLAEAIAEQADFQPAYMNIGCISLNNGLAAEALPFLQHARQLSPEHPDTLNFLSHAEKDLGLIEEAIVHAQQALRLAPASCAGLEAALRLALIHYLRDDHNGAAQLLTQAAAINLEGERSTRAYWSYLGLLLAWWKNRGGCAEKSGRALYAVGDSHVLSLHGLALGYQGRAHRAQALWIEGCKQWHLGKSEGNAYKLQFEAFLAGVPKGMPVLVSVGEIDCRPDEGILKAWRKRQTEALPALVAATIGNFVAYVAALRDRLELDITLAGVPASNVSPDPADELASRVFPTLLADFNRELERRAKQAGMGFLDLFALTDCGDGKADGQWHIDRIHLQPDAYAQAFRTHLLPPSEPSPA